MDIESDWKLSKYTDTETKTMMDDTSSSITELVQKIMNGNAVEAVIWNRFKEDIYSEYKISNGSLHKFK